MHQNTNAISINNGQVTNIRITHAIVKYNENNNKNSLLKELSTGVFQCAMFVFRVYCLTITLFAAVIAFSLANSHFELSVRKLKKKDLLFFIVSI